jgi:hypothetical protein
MLLLKWLGFKELGTIPSEREEVWKLGMLTILSIHDSPIILNCYPIASDNRILCTNVFGLESILSVVHSDDYLSYKTKTLSPPHKD